MIRRAIVFLSLLLLAAPAAAQAAALHGKWRGTGTDNEGEILELRADGTAISDEDRLTWTHVREGMIRLGADGETLDVAYSLDGDRLVLEILGQRFPFERVGGTPGKEQPPVGERPGSGPAPNPLAKPGADPFTRRFTGDGIALTLAADGSGYSGQLEFRGATYPARATADGPRLSGTFSVDGQPFGFEASLAGDTLTLTSGGTDYVMRGEAPAAPPAANPLARGGDREGGPPPLEGAAAAGNGKTWEHPRGWFTFEMPDGWSVWRETEDGLLLNPGFGPSDSLDALVLLRYGRLQAGERNVPIDQLLDRSEPELRRDLQGQGFELAAAGAKAHKVSVGEVPGAVLEWRGRAQSGSDVDVWCGALAKRDYYLAVLAVLVDGKGGRFLPRIKRVFQTLRPTPPETNPQLARALTGRGFAGSDSSGSGSFHCVYEFRAGGEVYKNMMFSGGEVGGQSEETGTYEVVGDDVFLYFRDGQESAQVVVEGGAPTALRFGQKVYRAR